LNAYPLILIICNNPFPAITIHSVLIRIIDNIIVVVLLIPCSSRTRSPSQRSTTGRKITTTILLALPSYSITSIHPIRVDIYRGRKICRHISIRGGARLKRERELTVDGALKLLIADFAG
jgi:hypothetical protein